MATKLQGTGSEGQCINELELERKCQRVAWPQVPCYDPSDLVGIVQRYFLMEFSAQVAPLARNMDLTQPYS